MILSMFLEVSSPKFAHFRKSYSIPQSLSCWTYLNPACNTALSLIYIKQKHSIHDKLFLWLIDFIELVITNWIFNIFVFNSTSTYFLNIISGPISPYFFLLFLISNPHFYLYIKQGNLVVYMCISVTMFYLFVFS